MYNCAIKQNKFLQEVTGYIQELGPQHLGVDLSLIPEAGLSLTAVGWASRCFSIVSKRRRRASRVIKSNICEQWKHKKRYTGMNFENSRVNNIIISENTLHRVAKLSYKHVRDIRIHVVSVYLRKALFSRFKLGVKRRIEKEAAVRIVFFDFMG